MSGQMGDIVLGAALVAAATVLPVVVNFKYRRKRHFKGARRGYLLLGEGIELSWLLSFLAVFRAFGWIALSTPACIAVGVGAFVFGMTLIGLGSQYLDPSMHEPPPGSSDTIPG